MALSRFRGRMPLIALILLAVVCLGLIGLACACLGDPSAVSAERGLQAPLLAALIELWPVATLGGFATALLMLSVVPARGRASPDLLQRFLF